VKILITGLGFISSNVAYFLSPKHDIKITYRSLNPVKELYTKILKEKGVDTTKLDVINETQKLEELVKSNDLIVNFVGDIQGDEKVLYMANVEVPSIIAQACKKYNKVMIHASGSTYGVTGKVTIEENHGEGLNPSTAFEKTKLQGEKELLNILGKNAIILRPTLVYGRFNAHVQFVTIYKLVKLGIIPKLEIEFQPVSARYIAYLIDSIANGKLPSRNYFYATECSLVNLSEFFQIYASTINKKGIQIPIPNKLAEIALPKEVKSLLKYAGTVYDCTVMKEYVSNMEFDREEVIENAKFLSTLDKNKILIPT